MRILQLNTNLRPGGIQRHIIDLSSYLNQHGHNVTVCGSPGAWSDTMRGISFVPLDVMAVADNGQGLSERIFNAARTAWSLRTVLKEHRIDLVHSHETAPALVARLALAGNALPTVFTYHGSEPDRRRQVALIARHCADWVLSPSFATLSDLVQHGVRKERTQVMGLGIDIGPVPDPARVAALRRDILGSEKGVLCLSLSRLAPQKGLDVMIEVARRSLAIRPDLVFVVAGQGPLDGVVQKWAETAGVAGRFRFTGPVGNVAEYLAAADLYLLTSRWEALPISIVEAFRAGLAVIATNCGGVAELVDSTVGRLCGVGDVPALTAAVLELANDHELRAKAGAAARQKSFDPRFDPEVVHARYEAFYGDLVADHRTQIHYR